MSTPLITKCCCSVPREQLDRSFSPVASPKGRANALTVDGNTKEITYPGLKIIYNVDHLNKIINDWSISVDQDQRPTMSEVLRILEEDESNSKCDLKFETIDDRAAVPENSPAELLGPDSLSRSRRSPFKRDVPPDLAVPQSDHGGSSASPSSKPQSRIRDSKVVNFDQDVTSLRPTPGHPSRQKLARFLTPAGRQHSGSQPAESSSELKHKAKISYGHMVGECKEVKPRRRKGLQYDHMLS